jgi:hypothetical protein
VLYCGLIAHGATRGGANLNRSGGLVSSLAPRTGPSTVGTTTKAAANANSCSARTACTRTGVGAAGPARRGAHVLLASLTAPRWRAIPLAVDQPGVDRLSRPWYPQCLPVDHTQLPVEGERPWLDVASLPWNAYGRAALAAGVGVPRRGRSVVDDLIQMN